MSKFAPWWLSPAICTIAGAKHYLRSDPDIMATFRSVRAAGPPESFRALCARHKVEVFAAEAAVDSIELRARQGVDPMDGRSGAEIAKERREIIR
jgi:hypothetical protein